MEEAGVSVRVYERAIGSVLYREVRLERGAKDRKSLGHRDRALALDQAKELARRVAELRLTGPVRSITIGHLFRLYFAHRAPNLSADRQELATRIYRPYFLAHFADDFGLEDLSQTHIDAYVVARRARTIISERHRGVTTSPRDGTIRNELNWLKSVIRWARGFRVGGRPLLVGDPLAGITFVREKNVRRPIASDERYQRTLSVADLVDASGRLACMLALARFTGRRVNAIGNLRASEVLFSRDQVARALAARGLDERRAEHMPHGAIAWPADSDKQGFEELTPISAPARAAIERYLRHQPRVGDAWLFPDLVHLGQPITRAAADHLLRRAEDLAQLPKLERGLWHSYRRLWASERKHLPDVDTAKAGGWRDLSTMKQSYQQPDAATMLRVVENTPAPSPGLTSDTPLKQSGGESTG